VQVMNVEGVFNICKVAWWIELELKDSVADRICLHPCHLFEDQKVAHILHEGKRTLSFNLSQAPV